MSFFSEMHAGMPGIDAIRENVEAVLTWGPWEYNRAFILPAIIDGSTRDAGHTSATTILRPGLIMGQLRATEGTDPLKWKQWNVTAADGTQDIGGVLLWDANMQMMAVDKDRWFGYILTGGLLKAASVLVPGAASASIVGNANEFYIRGAMGGRFLFDDYPHLHQPQGPMGFKSIVAKTAAYTVLPADNNTLFTNEGDTDSLTFTLPAVANCKGLRYGFYNAAGTALVVASAAAGGLIVFNDAAANSVALQTAGDMIGGMFEVVGISATKWMVIPHTWADGVLVQTITIAT